MSPQPGNSPSRFGGCFVMAFCSIFVIVGIGSVIGEHYFGMKVEGSSSAKVIVPVMFTLMGSGGIWLGSRVFRGKVGTLASADALPPKLKDATMTSTGQLRLAPMVSNRAAFLVLLFAALFWNGITWFMIIMMTRDLDGGVKWGALLFMAVFAIIGLGIIWALIHAFLKMTMTGSTYLTATAQTLPPGAPLNFTVHQSGSFPIELLIISLLCQETAKYRQGTDTVTKTEIVRTIPVCNKSDLTARAGQMLTEHSVTIPADAMHSFYSSNNQVDWILQVKMTLKGRPDVDQKFRLRVLPKAIVAQEVNARG